MIKEIKHLADDLELVGNVRRAFIAEMKSLVASMRKNDWDQFYAVADVIMQKYSQAKSKSYIHMVRNEK